MFPSFNTAISSNDLLSISVDVVVVVVEVVTHRLRLNMNPDLRPVSQNAILFVLKCSNDSTSYGGLFPLDSFLQN